MIRQVKNNDNTKIISSFENIFNEDIEDSFTDVCLEFGDRQSSAMWQFLFTFNQAMYEAGFFSYDEYEVYINSMGKLQDDFIAEYKEAKNTAIDIYQVIGILHYILAEDLLISCIEKSEESSLVGLIKSLPDNILDKITDPLKERYLDHLCYYYDCNNDIDLAMLIDLVAEYKKIRNRDYNNLIVYFNPEELYYFGE